MRIKRRKVKKEKAKKNKDTFCTESSLGCRRGENTGADCEVQAKQATLHSGFWRKKMH